MSAPFLQKSRHLAWGCRQLWLNRVDWLLPLRGPVFSCVVLGLLSWVGLSSVFPLLPFLSLFLNCSLSNSGMCSFITTDWLASIVTLIRSSWRHRRPEIDLGHLCYGGATAVVTVPVSKATAFWFGAACFWQVSFKREEFVCISIFKLCELYCL